MSPVRAAETVSLADGADAAATGSAVGALDAVGAGAKTGAAVGAAAGIIVRANDQSRPTTLAANEVSYVRSFVSEMLFFSRPA